MENEISNKIENKQMVICTDEDLSDLGYVKDGKRNIQRWRRKEDAREHNRNEYVSRGKNQIRFQGKLIYVEQEYPNDATCVVCGMTNSASKLKYGLRLVRHHHLYWENDPLKDTVLMCCACHAKHHWALRRGGENK
jgi:hypothetical protein